MSLLPALHLQLATTETPTPRDRAFTYVWQLQKHRLRDLCRAEKLAQRGVTAELKQRVFWAASERVAANDEDSLKTWVAALPGLDDWMESYLRYERIIWLAAPAGPTPGLVIRSSRPGRIRAPAPYPPTRPDSADESSLPDIANLPPGPAPNQRMQSGGPPPPTPEHNAMPGAPSHATASSSGAHAPPPIAAPLPDPESPRRVAPPEGDVVTDATASAEAVLDAVTAVVPQPPRGADDPRAGRHVSPGRSDDAGRMPRTIPDWAVSGRPQVRAAPLPAAPGYGPGRILGKRVRAIESDRARKRLFIEHKGAMLDGIITAAGVLEELKGQRSVEAAHYRQQQLVIIAKCIETIESVALHYS